MKLAARQLVLDTNVLVHLIRGRAPGELLDRTYAFRERRPRPIELVIDAYAEIDATSKASGRTMGKNDVWIAAIAKVQGAVVLTTDKDFDHLHPRTIEVEYVDPPALAQGNI